MACSVLTIENFSIISSTLPLRRTPAVSIKYIDDHHVQKEYKSSHVVPGWSNATTRSSPNKRLTSVDLPTFGRPIIAKRKPVALSCSSGFSSSGTSARHLQAFAEHHDHDLPQLARFTHTKFINSTNAASA
jgi:hypothetical protein